MLSLGMRCSLQANIFERLLAMYSHLSNSLGGWNKREGYLERYLQKETDRYIERKICKRRGWKKSKYNKRDFSFFRKMRYTILPIFGNQHSISP